jgi:hypothetical protein
MDSRFDEDKRQDQEQPQNQPPKAKPENAQGSGTKYPQLSAEKGYYLTRTAKNLRTLFFGGSVVNGVSRTTSLELSLTLELVCGLLAFGLFLSQLRTIISAFWGGRVKRDDFEDILNYCLMRTGTIVLAFAAVGFIWSGLKDENAANAPIFNNITNSNNGTNTQPGNVINDVVNLKELIGVILMLIEGFLSDRLSGKKMKVSSPIVPLSSVVEEVEDGEESEHSPSTPRKGL